jgi:predicted short-subunit dehydrogenase-like oxidoreductase (DUF2520 family)
MAAVCCRSAAHAESAAAFIGAGVPMEDIAGLPDSDLILLSVPDGEIAGVAQRLAQVTLSPGALVFHASGVLDVSVLAPLHSREILLGSLHPAYSFADPARAVAGFPGTLCALEGDEAGCLALEAFTRLIGGRPFRLAAGGKASYHAALSIASNFMVTLTGLAQSVACEAGIDSGLSRDLLGGLMRQTLENALALGPDAALTGPIVRGDAETVARHLHALRCPSERETYLALARATLRLARPRLDEAHFQALSSLLASDSAASRDEYSRGI